MLEWISKMLDRIFAVIGALIFLQFPLFMEQYSYRLSGHIDELKYQVKLITGNATQSGKTLEEYIQKFVANADVDFSRQGELMQAMVHRLESLTQSLMSLYNANVVTRPFVFLYSSDWDIVSATMWSYKPGLSITLESVVYALIGVFIGYYVYQILSAFFGRVADGLKRAQKKEVNKKDKS